MSSYLPTTVEKQEEESFHYDYFSNYNLFLFFVRVAKKTLE